MTREKLVAAYHEAKDAMNANKNEATTKAYHAAKDALNAFSAQTVSPSGSKHGEVVVTHLKKTTPVKDTLPKPAAPAEMAPIVEKPKASGLSKDDIVALIAMAAKAGDVSMVTKLAKLL